MGLSVDRSALLYRIEQVRLDPVRHGRKVAEIPVTLSARGSVK